MAAASPTQAALLQLTKDMKDVKEFMVRIDERLGPLKEQSQSNYDCLHLDGDGVLTRLRLVEDYTKRCTDSIGKKLGYDALKIALMGILGGLIYWILQGGLAQ